MAAKEILSFSGYLYQAAADDVMQAIFPVRSRSRSAVQIYQVVFDIGGSGPYSQTSTVATAMSIRSRSSKGVERTLHAWQQVLVKTGAADGLAVLPCSYVWTPPASFIVGSKELIIQLETVGATVPWDAGYAIYYKAVAVSETQAVQLDIMG